jgi:hypothetical protein
MLQFPKITKKYKKITGGHPLSSFWNCCTFSKSQNKNHKKQRTCRRFVKSLFINVLQFPKITKKYKKKIRGWHTLSSFGNCRTLQKPQIHTEKNQNWKKKSDDDPSSKEQN